MQMIENLTVNVLRDWLGRHLVGLNVMSIMLSGLWLVCLTRGLV
jgi:hypothetical protein